MQKRLKLSVAIFCVETLLAACMIVPKPTLEELAAMDAPPAEVKAKLAKFLPRVLSWYEMVEGELLVQGRALSVQQVQKAQALGVIHPEKIRVMVLEKFPMPSDPELNAQAKRHGLGSAAEGGRTMGYLIMLKPWVGDNETVLTHELVHVSQHDRLGREAFLQRYLVELELMGYARSPLELEAYSKQGSLK